MLNVALTGMFNILALICKFKMLCMEKMNVIAKISCYFERRVVTLKLRKEYLNIVIYNTPLLFLLRASWIDDLRGGPVRGYILR